MTPEQVAYDDDEQPEPEDEHEDGEGVGQEIAESEAFREEEHCDSPCSGNRPVALRASRAACAFFVACDTLPILAGGTRVRRRRLGSARMPSFGVSPVGGRVGN